MPSQTRFVNNVISAEWTDPANAFADDSLCTYTKTDLAVNTYNFINNPFTIPAGATITGLSIRIRWGGDGGDQVYFWVTDANGQNRFKAGTSPVAGCADAVLAEAGGDGDDWGGDWTPAHVNSADLIQWFRYIKVGKANFMYVDFVEITFYYTVPGVPYSVNVRLMGTVIAPYSAPVRNIGTIIAPFSALVRLIGSVYRSYSAQARLIGTVLLPFSARVRNIGTIIISYSALVRLVGTVIASYSVQVRNIGILIPRVVVAKCHAELKAIRRRIF